MPYWEDEDNKVVKNFFNEDARCYMEGGFSVTKYSRFINSIYQSDRESDCWEKTYVIDCGACDGERIDLFDLQKWFDDNREWIDNLKDTV